MSAAVLHGFVRFLEADGAREAIVPFLGPATRAALEAAPDAMVPAKVLGEAVAVLLQACGRAKVAQYGAFSAREIVCPLVRPAVERLLETYGRRPQSMLERLAEVLSPVLVGARTRWEPHGERSGTLTIEYEASVPDWPSYVVWQGALVEHLADCDVDAEVGSPEIAPDNTSARYVIRW